MVDDEGTRRPLVDQNAHSGETDHSFRWQTDHLFRRKSIRHRSRSETGRPWVREAERGRFHAADLFSQNGRLFLTESLPVSDRAERFRHQVPMLLADDPGAGKTIMAGLLLDRDRARLQREEERRPTMARFRIASFVALLVACSAACDDGAPTAPTPITPTPVTPPEPETITITMVLPYPQDANVNRGIPGVTVTCTVGCEGQQTEVTDGQGVVAFTGRIPLTIQAEKSGYISVERGVSDGSRVAMGNEWPPETREAIRQLGLTNVVDSGELLLIWGDEVYFQGPGHGGEYNCPDAVMVRNWRGRDFMVNTLLHELMHAWQGRNSTRPPCDTKDGWYPTESGQAWIAAIEKDLQEVGPIPSFDDDHSYGKPLNPDYSWRP